MYLSEREMLGFEYSENFDKMLDNGGRGRGVEHCGYLSEMPNLVDDEESPTELLFDDRKIVIGGEDDDDDDDMDRCSSSSNSSSIGNNSDEEQHQNSDDKEEEEEVQSSSCNYNNNNGGGCGGGGANFDDAIQALEDALPISKRGISRFYDGKSKSFASLTDAASASGSKDIAKPENTYAKRRRNLLAHNLMYGDNKKYKIYSSFHQLHQLGHTRGSRGGGITKRTTNSCKTTTTTLALAVAMSTTTNFNDRSSPCSSPRQTTSDSNGGGGPLLSTSSSPLLSPRARRNFSALRSFSFTDLQHFPYSSPSSVNHTYYASQERTSRRCTHSVTTTEPAI